MHKGKKDRLICANYTSSLSAIFNQSTCKRTTGGSDASLSAIKQTKITSTSEKFEKKVLSKVHVYHTENSKTTRKTM